MWGLYRRELYNGVFGTFSLDKIGNRARIFNKRFARDLQRLNIHIAWCLELHLGLF